MSGNYSQVSKRSDHFGNSGDCHESYKMSLSPDTTYCKYWEISCSLYKQKVTIVKPSLFLSLHYHEKIGSSMPTSQNIMQMSQSINSNCTRKPACYFSITSGPRVTTNGCMRIHTCQMTDPLPISNILKNVCIC